MKLTIATPNELKDIYEDLLTGAFPPTELKPLADIVRLWDEKRYLPLILKEEGILLGAIFLWLGEDNYWLIDHLAVPEAGRNRGIGARLLELVQDDYPDVVLFGESEAPTGHPEVDIMILRRLAFYDRCKAQTLGYDTAAFGVHYKTLAWSQRPIDETEIMRHHIAIYRHAFSPALYERFIQIPYLPGEPLKETAPWRQSGKDGGQ